MVVKRGNAGAVSVVVFLCLWVQLCNGFSPAIHSLPSQRVLGLAPHKKPIARARLSLLKCQAGNNEEDESKRKDTNKDDWMNAPEYDGGKPLSGQPPIQPRTEVRDGEDWLRGRSLFDDDNTPRGSGSSRDRIRSQEVSQPLIVRFSAQD